MTEWSAAWPLPGLAIGLISVLVLLRFVVPPAERGRVAGGIFFAGAYLLAVVAFGLVGRPPPAAGHHDWLRLLAVLLFSFAAVITSGLVLFDVVLARREVPRISRDLVQAIAYLITAAVVLTRSEVDVTKVFTASVLTTAVIGLALQDTLGNVVAGPRPAAGARLRGGRLDQPGRARSPAGSATSAGGATTHRHQGRRPDADPQLGHHPRRRSSTTAARPRRTGRRSACASTSATRPGRCGDVVAGRPSRRCPFVRAEPAPDCVLQEFKEDACSYICRTGWTTFQRDDAASTARVRSAIWYALHRAGMEIPFPSRNVHLTEIDEDRAAVASRTRSTPGASTPCRASTSSGRSTARRIDRLSRRLRHVVFGPGEVILRQG